MPRPVNCDYDRITHCDNVAIISARVDRVRRWLCAKCYGKALDARPAYSAMAGATAAVNSTRRANCYDAHRV